MDQAGRKRPEEIESEGGGGAEQAWKLYHTHKGEHTSTWQVPAARPRPIRKEAQLCVCREFSQETPEIILGCPRDVA